MARPVVLGQAKLSKLNPDPSLISSNNPNPNPSLLSPTPTRPSPRRPMTPTLLSFRFGAGGHAKDDKKQRRVSVNSVPTMSDKKGKEPVRGGEMNLNEDFGQPVWSSRAYDPFASPRRSSSPLSHGRTSSRPSTSSGITSNHTRSAQRGSIFTTASDVLGLKLGLVRRKGPSPKQIPEPVVLPDVIEITARKRDEEEEERSRLRVEAAQAIGLVDTDMQSHHIDNDEENEGSSTKHGGVYNFSESVHSAHYSNGARNSMYASHTTTIQGHGSSASVAASGPTPIGRYRSGSSNLGGNGGHSRANSANLTPVPAYPTTVSSLTQWQQHAGTLPKYYPPSSLRIFALSSSKNWKTRYIMLTSPTAIITRTRTPAVSYLHLFRGSGADEKELERLVINEDSVVFVSDDEVSGRRHVIKVGGIEGGAYKKELNVEESGRTMWFLQIEDQAESQQWISGIKNSILNQRALRAGLMPAVGTNLGVNEPRGDIDVILSMRAQGLINSNIRQHQSTPPSTAVATVHAEQNLSYAPSISEHSLRSQASAPKTTILAVAALKGLFSGSRPRSGSRAASVDTSKLSSQQQQHPHPVQHEGLSSDSGGGGMSSNLMSILRSTTPDIQSQSSGATATAIAPIAPPSIVRSGSPPLIPSTASEIGIDRHIIALDEKEEPEQQASNDFGVANTPPGTPGSPTSAGNTRAAKALSLGSMSLQPPPRGKRWTSTTVMTSPSPAVALTVDVSPANDLQGELMPAEMYKNAQLNNTTGSLGALTYSRCNKDAVLGSEPGSPTMNSMMTGSTDPHHLYSATGHHQGVRPSSAQSISTYSAATSNGTDSLMSSSITSTQRTSSSQGVRRWSRQGQGSLPPRTSPPAGPPPNPPSNVTLSSPSSPHLTAVINGVDRPSSRASSAISMQSQQSVVSSLPSFSKRASVSSVGTTSTSNSHSGNGHGHGVGLVVRSPGPHRSSMPPPRPAPTSALPPAPEEQQEERLFLTPSHSPRNQNLIPEVRSGRSRPRSIDSSVPSPTPNKTKRGSFTGRGFRLSMIAPSKPPPSSNLPPRPDELGVHDANKAHLPSTSFRKLSGGNSRLSRLNPIPASPDPNNPSAAGTSAGSSSGSAPFPPPKGPLPPTPSPDANNNTRPAAGVSRHTSLKQRLRIRSAPSSSSSTTAVVPTGQVAGTNASNANANHAQLTPAQALSNTSNITSNTLTNNFTISYQHNLAPSQSQHAQIRSSFASRFHPHHSRHSSSTSNHSSNTFVQSSSPPVPLSPTSSYFTTSSGGDFLQQPPSTPIGEKIMSIQDEASFLNLVSDTPMSPTLPLPPPSPPPLFNGGPLSSMSTGGGSGALGMPIRPLPAIPISSKMTSLSPPPRRNSKVVVEHNNPAVALVVPPPPTRPSPPRTPRTPSTPSIFEDTFGVEAGKVKKDNAIERASSSLPIPHFRSHTFGPSDPPSPIEDKKDTKEMRKPSLSLVLPPSPSSHSTSTADEMSATPPDTPSYETGGISPSSPGSVFSLGMTNL